MSSSLRINTPLGRRFCDDDWRAVATIAAIHPLREEEIQVRSLQDYHAQAARK